MKIEGDVLRIYHEECGFQKIVFPEGGDFASRMEIVRDLAGGLREKKLH